MIFLDFVKSLERSATATFPPNRNPSVSHHTASTGSWPLYVKQGHTSSVWCDVLRGVHKTKSKAPSPRGTNLLVCCTAHSASGLADPKRPLRDLCSSLYRILSFSLELCPSSASPQKQTPII